MKIKMMPKTVDSVTVFEVACESASDFEALFTVIEKADFPVGLTYAGETQSDSTHSQDKKAGYLESIWGFAMEHARGLMSMDADETELIMALLHLASRAKAARRRCMGRTSSTNQLHQWHGAGSQNSTILEGGICDGANDDHS